MASNTIDPEKGLMSSTARSVKPSWSSSGPENSTSTGSTIHTPLQLFQLLVGIHTPPSLTQDGVEIGRGTDDESKRDRTDNIGLYRRAKQQERKSRIAYITTSTISNTLYMIQILLAAVFTALSSYKETQAVTLTALGAVNTVLAGCLAWQKGQGVPQRYRKAQDQYQALILDIEMTERSFLDLENTSVANGTKLDPRTEKARLQKLFDTARADQQANYPDLYVSTGSAPAKDPDKDLVKQLEEAKAETAKVQNDLMAKIDALMNKLGDKVDAQVDGAIQKAAKV